MFVEVFRMIVEEFLDALAMSCFKHQIRGLPIHARGSLLRTRSGLSMLKLRPSMSFGS